MRKEEIKMTLFTDNTIVYDKNLKEILSEFRKVTGQKANIQKSSVFLCIPQIIVFKIMYV